MQKFKEIAHQNYIELRFNNKNLSELNEEEAIIKYKRNAAILGKIFSFTRGDAPQQQPQSAQQKSQSPVTQDLVNNLVEEVVKQEQLMKEKVSESEKRSIIFTQLINSSFKVSSEEELSALLQRLKENKLYDSTHPTLNQHSPFYLNPTESDMLPVQNRAHFNQSIFNEEGMTFEEIL